MEDRKRFEFSGLKIHIEQWCESGYARVTTRQIWDFAYVTGEVYKT